MSAGFAPVSIGTETDGSITMPGNRASLYAIKPTNGIVPMKGIVPISCDFDTAGPMAKSAVDVGTLLDVLLASQDGKQKDRYVTAAHNSSWAEIKVGVLEAGKWQHSAELVKPDEGATQQMIREINAAYSKIKTSAKSFHENITFIDPTELKVNGKNPMWDMYSKITRAMARPRLTADRPRFSQRH